MSYSALEEKYSEMTSQTPEMVYLMIFDNFYCFKFETVKKNMSLNDDRQL